LNKVDDVDRVVSYYGHAMGIARQGGGSIAIQNGWHDAIGSEALKWFFGGPSPHFEKMNYQSRFYSSYGTYNPFTNYRQ
jgi:hypothetical protein